MTSNLPPATLIQTFDDLQRHAKAWAREPLLAIDTESNSMYAYRERTCLVQLSTRSADYIIDPLAILDLSPLVPLLENRAIEKVFHAAENDIAALHRDFGLTVHHIFDTMIAARICGYKAVGLNTLLMEFEGVPLDKSHQRADWGQRPLPADMLRYAQSDTHYLPMLRDDLSALLEDKGRWAEAREAFIYAEKIIPLVTEFDPEGFWRLALPNQLTRRETAILRELYLLREQLAEAQDVPPYRVISDRGLVELARIAPRRINELYGINGLHGSSVRHHGNAIVAAVVQGERAKLPALPRRPAPADPAVVACYTLLREWRKNRAMERDVESDVIVPREALWMVAERKPDTLDALADIPGLGPWRIEQYGAELLDIVQKCK